MGEHLEENITKYTIEVIQEWGIASKLGYIQMDNAPNNDTIMKYVLISKLSTSAFIPNPLSVY
jgi:hypothetical protein